MALFDLPQAGFIPYCLASLGQTDKMKCGMGKELSFGRHAHIL